MPKTGVQPTTKIWTYPLFSCMLKCEISHLGVALLGTRNTTREYGVGFCRLPKKNWTQPMVKPRKCFLAGIPLETRVFRSEMDPISGDTGKTGIGIKWGQRCYLLQSIGQCWNELPTICLQDALNLVNETDLCSPISSAYLPCPWSIHSLSKRSQLFFWF